MRKLFSLVTAVVLVLGLACAWAEVAPDNFLVSDWKLVFTYEDSVITEQTVFIYEDYTFELFDEGQSEKGTWVFDGETLALTANEVTLPLLWNADAHRFSGEFNGMALTMSVPIEAESEKAPAADAPLGGWAVTEDQAITEDINNIFFQGLDSYQTGIITVAYNPVALLGTQVVAGTNYAVLSKASEINQGSKWVIVYLYQDLEGNASVLDIADIPLGLQ